MNGCRSGADVVVTDIPARLQQCQEIAEGIRATGRNAIAVAADVKDQASLNTAVEAVSK